MSEASADKAKPFAALGLGPAFVAAAQALGFEQPTAIQSEAIPAVLAGRDVLATAPTGSGKTAAYALPLLQLLAALPRSAPRTTQALVLVPTRELAAQVGRTLEQLAQHAAPGLKLAVLSGGVSINPQLMHLRGGADLVVATPGRLLDVIAHNGLKMDTAPWLVLDEADRLLGEGFAEDLDKLLALMKARRQTLMFSATFPPAVQALARRCLHEPLRIEAATQQGPGEQGPRVQQRAIEVDAPRRTALLQHLIRTEKWQQVLVFVATKYACDHVADKLRQRGITAQAFHGDASQGARTGALAEFKAGRCQVLVATDLAARGLHIDALPVVVNYDLARSRVDHVHRIGRTARAGASGVAVSFVSAETEAHFRLIEKRQGERVPREQVPGFERAHTAADAPPATGGIKGRRKSKKDKLREAGLLPPKAGQGV